MCKLKHLAVAAAIIGLATHVQAGYFAGSTDFEGVNALSDGLWSNVGESEIVADASVASVARSANRPASFNETIRTNVLGVDGDSPIVRNLQAEGAAPSASTIYADALVKGYPLTADASAPEAGSSDKILVYARISQDGTATNLCVLAAASDADSTATEFVLTTSIGKDEWHRIVIKATTAGYQVYCDGVEAANLCKTSGDVETFYALNAGAPMTSVAFQGTGYVDDLILSDLDPAQAVYTLTWDPSFASVAYTIDGITTNTLTAADGTYSFQAPDNTAVTIIGNNGYRAFTDTYTTDSSAPTHTVAAPTGLAYYTDGDGTAANPYEIPCYGALVAMKDAVAADASYRSAYYVQTADIDAAGEPAFAGIGTYADIPTNGLAFTGTYDGDGKKISNIAFESKSYAGVFNQVNGGTIKNLTVENATGAKGISIVGNAGNGATLQNLVAEGTFGSPDAPATHNAAGIVIRLSGGGAGTLVKDCTNNAAIYGSYTKLAGICALTQHKVDGGVVTFDGCANNGTLTSSHVENTGDNKATGLAGIVAYSSDTNVFVNCSNTGSLVNTSTANTDINGALIGYAYDKQVTDNGGNSAPSNMKMIGKYGNTTVIGFTYATVDNGIATTIPPPYTLSVGNTYLLEGNVAASGTPVATLAANETIAFDTALGYTFAGTVDAAAPMVVVSATSGTVTTYSTGYFPRTATAGQDGSAEHPFELADADDLQALKAAFAADASYRSLNYKVVADIDATALGYWDGIGANGTANSGLKGTLDGDGHTISNLQFSAGKYRAFFNRMDNATIKNLTINVKDFQETDAAEHGYAAFVGNMMNSKLVDCTATGTIGTTAKPSMHTSAGFAVKVEQGGVFVNCTNHISIVCSLTDNPKIGGIVGLMQGGAITNCWNDGDITITCKKCANNGNGAGGLVGYAQSNDLTIYHSGNTGTIQSTDTTADGGTYDIKVGTIIGMQNAKTATIAGDTIAQADAVPAGARANVKGVDFATVDNNVATFVSTLAAGNTYKVMLSGATATYNFTAPGTISFDETLFTPTYAITAPGLALTDTTDGTVKTYTAAAITAATWVGGAQGDWQTVANWDVGYVPTKDTVVTFTNDCAVGIYHGDCNCKEMVLNNANVTIVRADQGSGYTGGVDLHFEGNEGRAVSGTGTLGLDTVGLFNNNNYGVLMIGTDLAILNNVTFKGVKDNNQHAGSWTITGDTTIANVSGLTVKSIDDATLTFQGDIDIASGTEVTFLAGFGTGNHGAAIIVNSTYVTLAHPAEGSVTKLMLDTTTAHPNGTITINGQVVTDDPGYTVEITDSGKTYTVVAAAPAYPTYLEYADNAIKDAYDAWKVSNGADTESAYEKQFLLNVEPATDVPDAALVITAIKQNATAGWDITVECALANVGLEGTVGSARVNNGYLAVLYTDDLTGAWTAENINITASANGQVTVNVNKANAKFMKAKLSCTAEPAAQ